MIAYNGRLCPIVQGNFFGATRTGSLTIKRPNNDCVVVNVL